MYPRKGVHIRAVLSINRYTGCGHTLTYTYYVYRCILIREYTRDNKTSYVRFVPRVVHELRVVNCLYFTRSKYTVCNRGVTSRRQFVWQYCITPVTVYYHREFYRMYLHIQVMQYVEYVPGITNHLRCARSVKCEGCAALYAQPTVIHLSLHTCICLLLTPTKPKIKFVVSRMRVYLCLTFLPWSAPYVLYYVHAWYVQ